MPLPTRVELRHSSVTFPTDDCLPSGSVFTSCLHFFRFFCLRLGFRLPLRAAQYFSINLMEITTGVTGISAFVFEILLRIFETFLNSSWCLFFWHSFLLLLSEYVFSLSHYPIRVVYFCDTMKHRQVPGCFFRRAVIGCYDGLYRPET